MHQYSSEGIELRLVYDSTLYIEEAIDLVTTNLLIGACLATLVLLFFLRSPRAVLILFISIPISIITTFAFIYFFGRSLNIISLAGLTFATGMVLDSAIVVVENVFRHRELGKGPYRAAYDGANEVWGAILASTLTTLAVFIPIILIEDEAGQIFRDIAIAISIAVALSLIVAITVIPMLAARLLPEGSMGGRKREPHVRVYTEERDRPALVILDQRQSMFFGTSHCMKSVTAAEVAAVTAFRVLAKGDRIGGIVFDDTQVAEFKPQRSRRALYALLKGIEEKNQALNAGNPPVAHPMPLNKPLQAASRIARHDHLVVIISDFDGIDDETHRFVTTLARGNDVCLMLVHDPWAWDLPRGLNIVASDGQLQVSLDTTTDESWRRLNRAARNRLENIIDWQSSLGITVFPITTGQQTIPQLQKLLGGTPLRRRLT